MPYTMQTLPANVKKLPAKKQRQWLAIWNSAYSSCTKGGGNAKTCESKAFRQANGVTMSDEALETELVDFASESEPQPLADSPIYADDEIVVRRGLLFRAGDYPDKKFQMSAEELSAAAEAFTAPVPVDLEHTPTILDGKLGHVADIEAVGDELFGLVTLPKWLDDAIGDQPRKVSATWYRDDKTLAGLALVLNPRVEDAALLSAFAEFAAKRHDTPHGRMALQDLHDVAARSGAVCKAPTAKMASRHEANAIQRIHDTAVSSGAACHALKEGASPGYPMFGEPNTEPAGQPARRERKMSWKDRLMDFLAGMPDEEPTAGSQPAQMAAQTPPPAAPPAPTTPPPATTPNPVPAPQVDTELAQMRARAERAEQENMSLLAQFRVEQAGLFADQMVREGRAFPSERDFIVATYVQAATDDHAIGPVRFSDGATGSRVELFKRTIAARKPNQLDVERLPAGLVELVNLGKSQAHTDENGQTTPERRQELLGHTPLGRQAIKDGRNN
jgi:hypothetical protein